MRAQGSGLDRSCPAGCVAINVKPIDVTAACVEDREVVGLCHAADAEVIGNTSVGCFQLVSSPSLKVWTPSTGVSVGGGRNLFGAQGWELCAEAELWSVDPC